MTDSRDRWVKWAVVLPRAINPSSLCIVHSVTVPLEEQFYVDRSSNVGSQQFFHHCHLHLTVTHGNPVLMLQKLSELIVEAG